MHTSITDNTICHISAVEMFRILHQVLQNISEAEETKFITLKKVKPFYKLFLKGK